MLAQGVVEAPGEACQRPDLALSWAGAGARALVREGVLMTLLTTSPDPQVKGDPRVLADF